MEIYVKVKTYNAHESSVNYPLIINIWSKQTMKKTYIAPVSRTVQLGIKKNVMYSMSETTVTGAKGGWAREENSSWDIWGSGDDEE